MFTPEMPDQAAADEHIYNLRMDALEEATLQNALERVEEEDFRSFEQVQDFVDGDFAKITPVN